MKVKLSLNWILKYLSIYLPSVFVFIVPKIFLEYFSIDGIVFTINKQSPYIFSSRWIHFVSMFVLFEIVGVYILISGWRMRSRFLSSGQIAFVFLAEALIFIPGIILLALDIIGGKSQAGSNMIGAGNMEKALDGYTVLLTHVAAFSALNIMHIVLTIGAMAFTISAVSNFAICGIFGAEIEGSEAEVEARRDAYYRTLYASTALLTVGVLQLAGWIGLPIDNITEKAQFTQLVTAITIYLSILFSLIAIISASLSASAFNESLNLAISDTEKRKSLKIVLFDKTMLISVFLPAIVGYLIKVVPLLFA